MIVTYIANEQGSDIGSKGVKGVKGFNAVLPTGSDISAIGDIGVLKLEFCSCPSMVKVFSKIVKSIFKCSFFKGPTLIFKKKFKLKDSMNFSNYLCTMENISKLPTIYINNNITFNAK